MASITCDLYKERVYYAGLDTHSIWSVNYEGKDRRLIASHNKHITRPIRINVHESHVYVLNSGSKMMDVCSVYGRKECKPFMLNVNQPDNLIVAQRSRQKLVANACADDKCSTICAPSDMGGKCVCDFGHTVGPGDSCNDVLVSVSAPNRSERRVRALHIDGDLQQQQLQMHIIAHRRQLLLGNGDGFALFIRPNVFRNSVCLWPVF